jgi:transmembrane sensor
MTERIDEPREESGVHRLAALLRGDATCAVDKDHDEIAWRMVLRAAHDDDERGLRRGRAWRPWLLAPVAICALLAVSWGLYRGGPAPSSLRFHLDGREATSGPVAAEGELPQRMTFSDGSTVVLRPPGRLQVTNTHAHGATLSLERGRLDLAIRHHPGSRWKLEVGPYEVEVTGTRFNVTWDPRAGDFAVDLLEGAVRISGPGIATPIPLQVGQQFRANQVGSYGVERQPQIGPVPAAQAAEPRERDTTAATAKATRVASASGPGQGVSPDKLACDFARLVSSGRFEAAVSRAQGQGVEATLTECPTRSLFSLADAARYPGPVRAQQERLAGHSQAPAG